MAALSEWLQIMLGEIARKRDDLDRAREEEVKRDGETPAAERRELRAETSAESQFPKT